MSLSGKNKDLLSLETDLPLTREDVKAMSQHPLVADRDLANYLTFLEAIGAFESRKTDVKIYSEEFKL
jgi:hypothetical protein